MHHHAELDAPVHALGCCLVCRTQSERRSRAAAYNSTFDGRLLKVTILRGTDDAENLVLGFGFRV